VRIVDAIETTPQQSDSLLDEVQNEWDAFGGEEGIEAKDAGGGSVAGGEDGNCKCRFYLADFERILPTFIVNELLRRMNGL
jgi:hypothetical protein